MSLGLITPPIEDNATPMEINEDINMVGEPSNDGVAIKIPFEGQYKWIGKRIVIRTTIYKSSFIPQCIKRMG